MSKDVIEIDMQERFEECPVCNYKDGFHSIFERGDRKIRWLLICPACHRTFDLGIAVPG